MVRGVLVDRAIEVLSLETEEPLGCVKFGEAYYGSDKTECAILYNNGPESVNFVAVLDEDAIAQEMVICIFLKITMKNVFCIKLLETDGSFVSVCNAVTLRL